MAVRTKQAIRQAFIELLNERPLDKISVKDIAERSTVNRNTFYYYYADIYALVEEIFQTEAGETVATATGAVFLVFLVIEVVRLVMWILNPPPPPGF